MTTSSEWARGVRDNGEPLPVHLVTRYRARHHLVRSPENPTAYVAVGGLPSVSVRSNVDGVGSDLKILLEELGLGSFWCESCEQFAAKMNIWGVEGCKKNLDVIVARLQAAEQQAKDSGELGLLAQSYAAWKALTKFGWIDYENRHRSIAEEAIRRAEARLAREAETETLGEQLP